MIVCPEARRQLANMQPRSALLRSRAGCAPGSRAERPVPGCGMACLAGQNGTFANALCISGLGKAVLAISINIKMLTARGRLP